MFEYWDEGDRRWRKLADEWLTDAGCLTSEWFRSIGIKVQK